MFLDKEEEEEEEVAALQLDTLFLTRIMEYVSVNTRGKTTLTAVIRTVGWQVYVMATHVHVLPVELCGPPVVGGDRIGKGVMKVCNVMLVLANVVQTLTVMLLQVGVFVTRGTKTSQIVVQGDADLIGTVKMDSV